MIDAAELLRVTGEPSGGSPFVLATVVAFFESGAAQVRFVGEMVPAEKEYPYLGSYKPTIGDKVLLAAVSDSYIILGSVRYLTGPDRDLDERMDAEELYTADLKLRLGTLSGIDYAKLTQGKAADRLPAQNVKEAINYISGYFPHSDQVGDQAGNMNIENMYVEPSTGDLTIKRRNGVVTTYAKK